MITKMKDAVPWLIGSALAMHLVIFTQLKLFVFGLLIIGAGYFAVTAVRALNPWRLKDVALWKEVGTRLATALAMLILAGMLTMIGPYPAPPNSDDCVPRGRYDIC